MRALVVSEGEHERGGALEALVTRASSANLECEPDRVSRNDIHTHPGKGRGYFKRAVRWMLEARKRGFDALILVIDEDGYPERVREITDAQQYEECPVGRALGVAIRTFDAWMLADERALTEVLAYSVPAQPNPESIVEPKQVCARLLGDSKRTMRQRDMYAAVANAADIETLQARCPRGFGAFAARLREL